MLDEKYIAVYNLSAKVIKEYKDRYLPFVFFSCFGILALMGVFTYFNHGISNNVDYQVLSKTLGDISDVLYAIFMFGAVLALGVINFAYFNDESTIFKVKYADYERMELLSAIRFLSLDEIDELFVILETEVDHFTSNHEQLRYNLLMNVFYDKIDKMLEKNNDYERKSRFFKLGF